MTQKASTQLAGTVTRVRFEHLGEALGIGTARPRLSWAVETATPGWIQAAYEIEAYTEDGRLCDQTGRVESRESVLVAWPFAPLAPRQGRRVRVRAWGMDGEALAWSEPAYVEAALLDAADWSARFVTPEWPAEPLPARPGPLLRREFELKAGVIKRARLYITAHGVYEAYLNGQPVHDHVMAPGWTSYHHRLRYQVLDVTGLLRAGPNAIGALLGDGWFRGRMGFGGGRPNIYGDRLALLAQLEVVYADGSVERVVTDENWRASTGPVLENDIYDGETYDARLEKAGWCEPGYDERDWKGVQIQEWDLKTLFAPMGPPVRRTETIAPVSIFKSPSGRTLVDFGQNLVGRLRISVQGAAGQEVILRHAEVLEHGELGVRPLRHARATDRYILKGQGLETWEPRFTFHGFRYAEVEGWPGELKSDDLCAVVCHSDMERTGWFECSDPLVNRLHENTVWSMRGNFLDIPTDCPQRDERLGWTGDIQVFSPTASFLYDSAGFLASWLRDVAAEQKAYGVVPFVVPNVLPGTNPPAAAWGDAACVIPWVLYQRFGDVDVLANQFESMRAWVDLLEKTAGEDRLWDSGFQFGDWLDPAAPPDNPAKARTPGFIVATAYFARSAELTGLAAGVLGKVEEEKHYLSLAKEVRAAFNREYVTPSGRLLSDSSTAYALALEFALLPTEEQRQHAGKRLAALARASGYRISTGFVGTPLICDALCGVGLHDAAFRLLMTRENPSWLYPVTMGATTIWERWDSMLPDGTINPGEMTSFNHYALGAVADWMHRTIGGLAPAAPGYRRLEIAPRPGGGLTSASTKHITPYGPASCAWKIEGDQITVEVEVPPNTTASLRLPGRPGDELEVGSGKYCWTYPYSDTAAKRAPLTLDSTIGEIIDDAEAFTLVLAAIRKHGTELADRMLSQEERPLRESVSFMPQSKAILASIEEALASLRR
jgi:alpha-L-rhamnosidase